jgi:TonB family protein
MSSDRSTGNPWPRRLIALAAIVLIHAALFYFVINERQRTPANADARQAFTPVERESGGSAGSLTTARSPAGRTEIPPPDSRWRFEPFEVWPVNAAGKAVPGANASSEGIRTSVLDESESDVASAGMGAPRVLRWSLPEYPLAWARAGEEGSVYLDVHIDAEGKPTEVKLLPSSASPRLEQLAQGVVSSWQFTAPTWHSTPVSGWAEIEVHFDFYRYRYSFIKAPARDGGEPRTGKKPVRNDEEFRRIVGMLSTSGPMFANLENTQPDFQQMRNTVVKWGRARTARLLNPKESEWKEYTAEPEFRSNSWGGTIAIRWDRYDVLHEHAHATWKVAVDPYGRIWAARADILPN